MKELMSHSDLIGDEGAIELGGALSNNSTLQTLDLSDDPIGEEGLKGLTLGLSLNKSLTKLYLNGTRTTLKSLHCMIDLVVSNATLTAFPTRTHSTEGSPEQKELMLCLNSTCY